MEGALKLAKYSTGRQGIIAFSGAFHGRTLGALSVTNSAAIYRKKYHPLLPSVFHVPYPYCFRCPFNEQSDACTRYLEETLNRLVSPEELAAVIIELVLGEGGYVPAPGPFLKKLRELCSSYGIMLIFDEVQSGVGRSGNWFATDHYGVVPDILTVAKGVASGFPLSVVVAGKKLMQKWATAAYGTTFGGNPVSCAATIATIEVIEDENLLKKTLSLANLRSQD